MQFGTVRRVFGSFACDITIVCVYGAFKPTLHVVVKMHKVDVSGCSMINALAAHDTNAVQQLLTSGYDVNMNLGDDMGECNVLASHRPRGWLVVVHSSTELLHGGTKSRCVVRTGSALHYSIEVGHWSGFRVLLSHGADIEALVEDNHQTPLMKAAQLGQPFLIVHSD